MAGGSGTAAMQAASRESLAAATARLDAHVDGSTSPDLARLGDELFAVTRLVAGQPALRRALADPATPGEARTGLLRQVLGGRVGDTALEFASGLVAARWSSAGNLVDGLESLARRAVLGVAESDGTLDDVEDELFRFGRILNREPQLTTLLADTNQPEDGRVGLLDAVLGTRVTPVAGTLLRQTVRLPRGRHLDIAAEELAELAAARRDRYVARVRTAVGLTPEQEQRLTASLTRLYGRPMSLQVELDEDLLGGLVVEVGGEVIDGSVAGRLAAAQRSLPS